MGMETRETGTHLGFANFAVTVIKSTFLDFRFFICKPRGLDNKTFEVPPNFTSFPQLED